MEKEKLGKLVVIVIYFILGAVSFIAAGLFMQMGFVAQTSDKFVQSGIFIVIGTFWMIMFGERRNKLTEDFDEFLGGGLDDFK